MDDVANYADHMVVLEKGTVIKEGAPQDVFKDAEWLESKQLGVPAAVSFGSLLSEKTGLVFNVLPLTTNHLADVIAASLKLQPNESEAGDTK